MTALDGFRIAIDFGIEKDEMFRIAGIIRICCKVLFECFSDTIIDNYLVAFAALLLFYPKASFDPLAVIQEMSGSQLQQVRDA